MNFIPPLELVCYIYNISPKQWYQSWLGAAGEFLWNLEASENITWWVFHGTKRNDFPIWSWVLTLQSGTLC